MAKARLPHHLPRRFGGVRGQCRAGCSYPVHKFRGSEASGFISEYIIENCPVGHLAQTQSGSIHRTGVFVARLITHAHFQEHQADQRQPGKCSSDQRRYSFAILCSAMQVTNPIQKRIGSQQDRVDAISRPRGKQS